MYKGLFTFKMSLKLIVLKLTIFFGVALNVLLTTQFDRYTVPVGCCGSRTQENITPPATVKSQNVMWKVIPLKSP